MPQPLLKSIYRLQDAADYSSFNASLAAALALKVPTARILTTTAPLTGGGDLSADRTIAIPVATTSVDGYLSATDWNTFNGKASTASPTFTGPVTINPATVYGSDQTPGQNFSPALVGSFAGGGGGNIGFDCTIDADGRITKLWFYDKVAASYTVYIKTSSGTTLASATATGTASNTWTPITISPLSLSAGSYQCRYTMASSSTVCYGGTSSFPHTNGNITVTTGYTGSPNSSYIGMCDFTFEISTSQSLTAGLTNYASNAAAVAAGLPAGAFYRNGDNVCVVH